LNGDGRGTRLHVQVYAEDPQARITRDPPRPAPLLGNDRRLIEMMNGSRCRFRHPVITTATSWHGRQHLPRRPRWRKYADAAEPDRNGLVRQPAELYLPVDPLSTTPRRSTRRRSRRTPVAALVMRRLIALRKRYDAFNAARSSSRCLRTAGVTFLRILGDERTVVANLAVVRPVRRARPVRVQDDAGLGGVVPADRQAAVPAHARPARLLLVLARAAGRDGRGGLAAAADRAQGALAADRRERAREGGAREAPARVAAEPALVRREGATHALGGDRGRDPRSRSVRDGRCPAGRLPRPHPSRVHGGGQRDLPGAAHGVGARGVHRAHASRLVARPAALRRRRARAARGAARTTLRAGAARSDPRAEAHRDRGRRRGGPGTEPARRDPESTVLQAEQSNTSPCTATA
jgi:hypothetical protein